MALVVKVVHEKDNSYFIKLNLKQLHDICMVSLLYHSNVVLWDLLNVLANEGHS